MMEQSLLQLPTTWRQTPCARFARARSVPLLNYTARSLDYTKQLGEHLASHTLLHLLCMSHQSSTLPLSNHTAESLTYSK